MPPQKQYELAQPPTRGYVVNGLVEEHDSLAKIGGCLHGVNDALRADP